MLCLNEARGGWDEVRAWLLISSLCWDLLFCFTRHVEEISIKTCLIFVLCNSRVLSQAVSDHETRALKSFLSLNLQNVGVDRSREEALRTVPNHL